MRRAARAIRQMEPSIIRTAQKGAAPPCRSWKDKAERTRFDPRRYRGPRNATSTPVDCWEAERGGRSRAALARSGFGLQGGGCSEVPIKQRRRGAVAAARSLLRRPSANVLRAETGVPSSPPPQRSPDRCMPAPLEPSHVRLPSAWAPQGCPAGTLMCPGYGEVIE